MARHRPDRGRRRAIAPLLALGLATLTSACASPLATETPPVEPVRSETAVRLEGAVGSLQQLAFETLEGLSSRDTARLERIRLTEYEHNELVWPELPASAPEVNYPVDLAWQNISIRNLRARERLFWKYAEHRLMLHDVDCREEPETFPSFTVHKDCWVQFSVEGGQPVWQQFFRYALDWQGQYKIFRYYDDD